MKGKVTIRRRPKLPLAISPITDSLPGKVEEEIDSFIRFLATERGLSDNYQLSTRRSLTEFAAWCSSAKKITGAREVTQPLLSEYLSTRKRGGLAAASIKLIVVALKIFFRSLVAKGLLERDPTETLTLPAR